MKEDERQRLTVPRPDTPLSGADTSVPEPGTLWLLLLGGVVSARAGRNGARGRSPVRPVLGTFARFPTPTRLGRRASPTR